MDKNGDAVTILMADDDHDDRVLTKDAMEEARLANCLHFVEDGEELNAYLNHRGQYVDPAKSSRPDLMRMSCAPMIWVRTRLLPSR